MPALILPKLLGVSIEVYVIVGILAAIHYALFRWILQRWWPRYAQHKLLTATLALIAAPVTYFAIWICIVLSMSYYPDKDFEPVAWQARPDERYEYVEGLIESGILMSIGNEDAQRLLGPPDEASGTRLMYYLGHRPGLFNIDPDYLVLHFANDKVTRVEWQRE